MPKMKFNKVIKKIYLKWNKIGFRLEEYLKVKKLNMNLEKIAFKMIIIAKKINIQINHFHLIIIKKEKINLLLIF